MVAFEDLDRPIGRLAILNADDIDGVIRVGRDGDDVVFLFVFHSFEYRLFVLGVPRSNEWRLPKMSIESMREEFRGYRGQFVGQEVFRFDARVRSLASELSDGEEITPYVYLQAAREVVWELKGAVAA